TTEEAWERLVPVIQDLLDEIHDQKFFRYWLSRRAKPWAPAELEAARGLLKMGGWHNSIARETARKIAHFMMGGDMERPELMAMREELVQQKKVRLVVAGHTHQTQVCLIGSDKESDRFYVNTGTWRNRIPSTPDERTFGKINALTYIMPFTSEEDRQHQHKTLGTFDYWSGYTRHFMTDESREAGFEKTSTAEDAKDAKEESKTEGAHAMMLHNTMATWNAS